MQFSDTTNYNGLIQSCESTLYGSIDGYGRISGNDKLLKTFTRHLNRSLDEVTRYILKSDTRWQFDDTTYDTYPIAVTDLVVDQQDYPLSVEHLKITRVEVKDNTGNYHRLLPVDQNDIKMSLTEFYEDSALPFYYDKIANSVFLYPAPASGSVTTSEGLKVWYQREPNYFSSEDTTKKAGIPSIYFPLIHLLACQYYARDEKMYDLYDRLSGETQLLKRDLQDYYQKRDKDDRTGLRAKWRSSR